MHLRDPRQGPNATKHVTAAAALRGTIHRQWSQGCDRTWFAVERGFRRIGFRVVLRRKT